MGARKVAEGRILKYKRRAGLTFMNDGFRIE